MNESIGEAAGEVRTSVAAIKSHADTQRVAALDTLVERFEGAVEKFETAVDEARHGRLVITATKSGTPFATGIVEDLKRRGYDGLELLDSHEITFGNTEMKHRLQQSVRGAHLVVVADCETRVHGQSVNDALMSAKLILRAASSSYVQRKTLVMLSHPYARQDRAQGREPISVSLIAQELEDVCGVNHLMVMDVHNEAIQCAYRTADFMNLRAARQHVQYIRDHGITVDTGIFTDQGANNRAKYVSKALGIQCTGYLAYRDPETGEKEFEFVGSDRHIKGKSCIIIEDMIDTGGTIKGVAEDLMERGASQIWVAATHGMLNGSAPERFTKLYDNGQGPLRGVICTNSVFHTPEFKTDNPWYQEIPVTRYVALAIDRVHKGGSVSDLLDRSVG